MLLHFHIRSANIIIDTRSSYIEPTAVSSHVTAGEEQRRARSCSPSHQWPQHQQKVDRVEGEGHAELERIAADVGTADGMLTMRMLNCRENNRAEMPALLVRTPQPTTWQAASGSCRVKVCTLRPPPIIISTHRCGQHQNASTHSPMTGNACIACCRLPFMVRTAI